MESNEEESRFYQGEQLAELMVFNRHLRVSVREITELKFEEEQLKRLKMELKLQESELKDEIKRELEKKPPRGTSEDIDFLITFCFTLQEELEKTPPRLPRISKKKLQRSNIKGTKPYDHIQEQDDDQSAARPRSRYGRRLNPNPRY